jgi:hypothetical protein
MKKLLLSTAIILASSSQAFASNAPTPQLSDSEYAKIGLVVQSSISIDDSQSFYAGDFQSVARQVAVSALYTGNNSALMGSVVAARY